MLKVGVLFGGGSREREVSFAGGRTVYDNLDKNLFEAIPIFVDPFGNMAVLDWAFIYRGTIRDFYPPINYLPDSPNTFQIYADSLKLNRDEQLKMLSQVGKIIEPRDLDQYIDFAFLALHGAYGEDGTIQGLLEWYGIPYSGSGILASAIGMNKAAQKLFMDTAGFAGPSYVNIKRQAWIESPQEVVEHVRASIPYPLVVKAANQGSSIGISVLKNEQSGDLSAAIDKAFFRTHMSRQQWQLANQVAWVRALSDIRSDIGFPLFVDDRLVYHPEEALTQITASLKDKDVVTISALHPEVEVVVESFIDGREFSCIVIRNHDGNPTALPPTEIVKSKGFYDYKSKYLPGLSRKITPIDLPDSEIERLRQACQELYIHFGFQVYARIDGFYTTNGEIFLNDPNTTSGMMPSSFFFHQASEIGLNPSQFLTYIIRTSLVERSTVPSLSGKSQQLLQKVDADMLALKTADDQKIRVGVLMGGYSTERHISVESGRNIYEKLSSSSRYEPIPLFLTGNDVDHQLYVLPVNVMLKDNADDIKGKVEHFHQPHALKKILSEFKAITEFYTTRKPIFEPERTSYTKLKEICSEVFVALHGRPGEDGEVQRRLDEISMPYNGSGVTSSALTIDKYATNNLLRQHGFNVADNILVHQSDWLNDQNKVLQEISNIGFPLIAKPSDEGCSSAVKKLKSVEDVLDYAAGTFRPDEEISADMRQRLKLDDKEEFPKKPYFLIERLIDKAGADHFLEITGGLLTKFDGDKVLYEIFEPSEALAEGEILSLAEKFLAGEGQNITPARFSKSVAHNASISSKVRLVFEQVARTLQIEGYCRIDAFVRINHPDDVEVFIIEVNSLPGMTPATCIYHQAAINGYKPFEFIDKILTFGRQRLTAQAH